MGQARVMAIWPLGIIFGMALWASFTAAPPAWAEAANCRASAEPGVDWSECRKRNLILSSSDLSGATLKETDFSATDLSKTTLENADLWKVTVIRASLARTKAKGANFERAVGSRTVFRDADLTGANFFKSEMPRAVFAGAMLSDVNFDHSELARADFADAEITGARFQFAVLARADLRDTRFEGAIDLTGAFLFLTRLEGVDLSAAQGLAQWQVDMACGDDATVLPAGLERPADWACGDE